MGGMTHDHDTVTAFLGDMQLAAGSREAVTRTLEDCYPADLGTILVFDDRNGRLTDLDHGYAAKAAPTPSAGRPRLGVKAREVTLLPRHWNRLAAKPGRSGGLGVGTAWVSEVGSRWVTTNCVKVNEESCESQ